MDDAESTDLDDENDESADNTNVKDGSGGEHAAENAASRKVVLKDLGGF